MPTLIDKSAIFAILDEDDRHHANASDIWATLLDQREQLITTNYVVVETAALVARRLGFEAVRTLHAAILPVLQVRWVDQELHERAAAAMLTAGQRNLSLVDCVSFAVMRQLGLDTAFAFDDHFGRQGFRCIP